LLRRGTGTKTHKERDQANWINRNKDRDKSDEKFLSEIAHLALLSSFSTQFGQSIQRL